MKKLRNNLYKMYHTCDGLITFVIIPSPTSAFMLAFYWVISFFLDELLIKSSNANYSTKFHIFEKFHTEYYSLGCNPWISNTFLIMLLITDYITKKTFSHMFSKFDKFLTAFMWWKSRKVQTFHKHLIEF